VVVALLALIRPVLFSLVVSLMLYSVLTPFVNRLRRRGWPIARAVSLVMAVTTIGIVAVGAVLFPVITDQMHQLSHQAGQLDQRLGSVLTDADRWLARYDLPRIQPAEMTSRILDSLSSRMAAVHDAMRGFFSDVAASLLLIPLTTFFLLCDFKTLRNQVMQLLPNRQFELGWIIYNRAARQLMNYIAGVATQAMIIAAICTVGFWVVGVDYAPLLGISIGLLNTIPFFGIALAKVLTVVMVLMSDDPSGIAILLALSVVLAAQAFDNAYVIPHIVAKSANLHPLTVMLGVMLGGFYSGFFGLILTIPILFSLKVIHVELIRGVRRQREHHIDARLSRSA